MMNMIRFLIVLALISTISTAGAHASSRTISVSGGGIQEVSMTIDQLESIGMHKIETTTPWHSGTVEFEGPLLRDVLMHLKANGRTLRVTALNDYAATIPVSDLHSHEVMLATRIGGERMSVRNYGPAFIVYDYDNGLNQEVYYARSVWQITGIEVQ